LNVPASPPPVIPAKAGIQILRRRHSGQAALVAHDGFGALWPGPRPGWPV